MARSGRSQGGSMSSAGSLSFSEYSAFSDVLNTPPPASPRSPACFSFEDSPASSITSVSSIEDDEYPSPGLSTEAADALHRLDLHLPPNFSLGRTSPTSSDNSLNSPTKKTKKRPSGLKMDFSNVQKFEHTPPSTATLLGAPLIGCLPTPSPTTLTFSITPRPGLASRFSDESVPQTPAGESPPFSSSNPVSARASISVAHSGVNGWPAPAPITPRTVDAMDCFGITSSAAPCLMRRAGSRDKPSLLGPRSPDCSRTIPRSPLAMPAGTQMSRSASAPRTRSTSSPGSSVSGLLNAREAKTLYNHLLPTERFELLATPDEFRGPFEWSNEEDSVSGINPYFAGIRV